MFNLSSCLAMIWITETGFRCSDANFFSCTASFWNYLPAHCLPRALSQLWKRSEFINILPLHLHFNQISFIYALYWKIRVNLVKSKFRSLCRNVFMYDDFQLTLEICTSFLVDRRNSCLYKERKYFLRFFMHRIYLCCL